MHRKYLPSKLSDCHWRRGCIKSVYPCIADLREPITFYRLVWFHPKRDVTTQLLGMTSAIRNLLWHQLEEWVLTHLSAGSLGPALQNTALGEWGATLLWAGTLLECSKDACSKSSEFAGSCFDFWISYFLAQTSLKLTMKPRLGPNSMAILLLQPPKCWDYVWPSVGLFLLMPAYWFSQTST